MRPLVYAHRGGAALRPENTIASFDYGLSLGADGLEFDVRLSRDGVVVVHHDATLERTTNGRGSLGVSRRMSSRRSTRVIGSRPADKRASRAAIGVLSRIADKAMAFPGCSRSCRDIRACR